MNFRPRSDACILGYIQPIDLQLKTLVDLDFNDRRCHFLCWGHRIGAITENAQKGSLVDCQEDVPYTALTIVCTINVSIDCDCFDVSNPPTRKNIHKRKSSQ